MQAATFVRAVVLLVVGAGLSGLQGIAFDPPPATAAYSAGVAAEGSDPSLAAPPSPRRPGGGKPAPATDLLNESDSDDELERDKTSSEAYSRAPWRAPGAASGVALFARGLAGPLERRSSRSPPA